MIVDSCTGTEEPMKKLVSLSTGVRIEYVEQGNAEADGVPVIFLHGVTDSWRSFERVLPLLPPSIHAFALSQRGHGDSSRPGPAIASRTCRRISSRSWMRWVCAPRSLWVTRWGPAWRNGSSSITLTGWRAS